MDGIIQSLGLWNQNHYNHFIYLSLPEGLEDVTKFPDLVAELLRRDYTEDEVKKIVGENLIRVFEKAEQVSQCDNVQVYACN